MIQYTHKIPQSSTIISFFYMHIQFRNPDYIQKKQPRTIFLIPHFVSARTNETMCYRSSKIRRLEELEFTRALTTTPGLEIWCENRKTRYHWRAVHGRKRKKGQMIERTNLRVQINSRTLGRT